MDQPTTWPVSVVMRARDSEHLLPVTVASVRRQTIPAQIIIVVDTSSVDGTEAAARQLADVVVTISGSDWSYGRALNLGAAAATSEVHCALSAHSPLPQDRWLEIAVDHIANGAVAACGAEADADGRTLTQPLFAEHQYLTDHPQWGLTNHASAWSAQTWRLHHFDEALVACEDHEWSWRATGDGGIIVFDPALVVPHLTRDGRGYLARRVRELRANLQLGIESPLTLTAAWRELAQLPDPDSDPRLHSRPFGRRRVTDLTAKTLATVSNWRAAR